MSHETDCITFARYHTVPIFFIQTKDKTYRSIDRAKLSKYVRHRSNTLSRSLSYIPLYVWDLLVLLVCNGFLEIGRRFTKTKYCMINCIMEMFFCLFFFKKIRKIVDNCVISVKVPLLLMQLWRAEKFELFFISDSDCNVQQTHFFSMNVNLIFSIFETFSLNYSRYSIFRTALSRSVLDTPGNVVQPKQKKLLHWYFHFHTCVLKHERQNTNIKVDRVPTK